MVRPGVWEPLGATRWLVLSVRRWKVSRVRSRVGRHALEFGEIEFADSLEGLGQRAVVLVGRQRFEPIGILRLQLAELGDGVLPTPGATAMVGRATGADHRRIGRARDAVTGLALGVGHGFLADRLARHGATPNRYVTKPGWCGAAQARFLKRQLSLPVSTMSQ